MKRIIFVLAALSLAPAGAGAQFGLQSASGTTSLLATRFSEVALETGESSLSVLFTSGRKDVRTWFANTQLTLLAEGGERDLFSGGHWVPGVRFRQRMAWQNNDETNGGWVAFYGSVGYEAASRSLVRQADDGGTSLVLEDRTGQTLSLGVGVNSRLTPFSARVGFSADLEWNWGVPVSGSKSQVCFTQAQGPVGEGAPAVVSRCSQRYFGGAHDVRSGHLRMDFESPFMPRRSQAAADLRTNSLQQVHDSVQAAIREHRRPADEAANRALRVATEHLADAWDALGATPPDSARLRAARLQAVAEATGAVRRAEDDRRATADSLAAANTRRDAAQHMIDEVQRRFLVGPTVTLLGSASTDLAVGAAPRLNVAAGPALHPSLAPMKVTAALLLELQDLTEVDGPRSWRDRFAVRLYLGVPFGAR